MRDTELLRHRSIKRHRRRYTEWRLSPGWHVEQVSWSPHPLLQLEIRRGSRTVTDYQDGT